MLRALFCLRGIPPPVLQHKTILLGEAEGFNVVRHIGHREAMAVVEIIEGAVNVMFEHRRFPLPIMVLLLFYNTMS